MRRSRILCFGLLLATVALGLATRQYPSAFPPWLARDGGDALWAGTVFWLVALLRPGLATRRVARAALAIAYGVELSQLYHAPWIDAVRASRLGALVLGQGFVWSDLFRYAAGVGLVAPVDAWLTRHSARQPPEQAP